MLAEDREHHIFKLLFILLFWVFFRISMAITVVVGIIQWVMLWFEDEPNQTLFKFSQQLTIFQTQISAYMTFQSNEKVFPFNDWPEVPQSTSEDADETSL
ncbi:DUF4389 domain-containing protein [Reinekea marina]|uniref:DUF4389 domain-containing protein n=1 Tax=Reinekea marina TaxID=1310421 RepID=A0ABV7WTP2_9GAMM|nr:DUF4389 domain-containing protein [Reinekea marina]MDN3649048.1 DUF4389 domain-containing protein [Reinekea marina]